MTSPYSVAMNQLFNTLGIAELKPLMSAFLLPPVPFLILILVGARLILPRRGLGWTVLLLGVIGVWLSMCVGTGRVLETFVLQLPGELRPERIQALKAQANAHTATTGKAGVKGTAKTRSRSAIIVLGGGRENYAPEYGRSSLQFASIERLRYGVWLSKETGLPLGFSGGIGWAQEDGMSEAAIAADIAKREFNHPVTLLDEISRDTHQNAVFTLRMLEANGITHVLLVTHGYHMRRAVRNFEEVSGGRIQIEAAPMGLARRVTDRRLDWLPTEQGFRQVHRASRELLGLFVGA
jgi:uncharacterized SAM-binding protein YcdF (DUF218 family)